MGHPTYCRFTRKLKVQGGAMTIADILDTLLGALPEKYGILREAYYTQTPTPTIDFVWDRMLDIENT